MGIYLSNFCESKVSQYELRTYIRSKHTKVNHLNFDHESFHVESSIGTLKLEVSFHHGSWDLAPNNPPYLQTRTGEHVRINKILNT